MSKQLSIRLNTALTLLDQFQSTLSTPPEPTVAPQKDALPLLSASTEALKSQVTKLSLLAINTPFTPSAVSAVLSALIESVLPSLVTAAALVTPGEYTKAFHGEVGVLSRTVLKELAALVGEVKGVAEKNDSTSTKARDNDAGELSQPDKDAVTVATGRVWDSCDCLCDVAAKGVVGFVVRRVEEWRDLVADAVSELEEWDPDEDDDGFFDDIVVEDVKPNMETGNPGREEESVEDSDSDEKDTAALHACKKSTLRVLKPVAQVFPAIISNRLKNVGSAPSSSPEGIGRLESLMSHLRGIPDYVDEMAGALYDDELEKSGQYLEKTKSCAASAVNAMALPWVQAANGDREHVEDKFTVWSRTWLKVMDEVSKPANDTSNAG
ncbi:hypothetical protein PHISP_06132 [Aspergillus sp. HF37]|nr:hypothetical protein PHISP_06132 [Aspergillus sp. HF37]